MKKIYKIASFFILLTGNYFKSNSQFPNSGGVNRIIIEGNVPHDYNSRILPNSRMNDSVEIRMIELNNMEFFPTWNYVKEKTLDGKVKWVLLSDKPLLIMSPFWGYPAIVQPGDSIHIKSEDGFTFLGKGAEGFSLQHHIDMERKRLINPIKNVHYINSLVDYLTFNKYLNKQLDLIIPYIDSYKNKVSEYAYLLIKAKAIYDIEYLRARAFWAIFTNSTKKIEISPSDMASIYDSTLNGRWAKWLRLHSDYCNMIWYFDSYNKLLVLKENGFSYKFDSLYNRIDKNILYYNTIKHNFNGLIRERLLQYIVAYEIVRKTGFNEPRTDSVLADYYRQPGFVKYKKWMRDYVNALSFREGQRAPDFTLIDSQGNSFSDNNIKGKVALLYFWNSGCKECIEINSILGKIQEAFKQDSNVVILGISGEKRKEQWIKYITQGQLVNKDITNLFAGNKRTDNPVFKTYFVNKVPKIYLLNKDGRIFEQQVSELLKDTGRALINLVNEHVFDIVKERHALINDGPYVFHTNDSLSVYSIKNNNVSCQQVTKAKECLINVQSDRKDKSFQVKLKSKLEFEPSEYIKPEKLFVFSDIEGNFEAMRRLLQSNKIIDENFNWIFGNGHLVFLGDMFDRGQQVAECLWLIYFLEDKAKTAGGYVHFLLGNHEIMNLNNDLRYMKDKYRNNSRLLGVDYISLYGENSELGRWLRTKNIMERIGDMLFVHGGISPVINRLPLSIKQLNEIARPHYTDKIDFVNPYLSMLFDTRTSPFWFRGYYEDGDKLKQIPTIQQVDSSLQKFGVNYIVTGHTIVGDTISLWYNKKIINIDTKHANGASEALLVDENKYYRVNTTGNRILLFRNTEYYFSIK